LLRRERGSKRDAQVKAGFKDVYRSQHYAPMDSSMARLQVAQKHRANSIIWLVPAKQKALLSFILTTNKAILDWQHVVHMNGHLYENSLAFKQN
ncbi:hypothetical protein T09_9952, partial [Trichinella sp. T9]